MTNTFFKCKELHQVSRVHVVATSTFKTLTSAWVSPDVQILLAFYSLAAITVRTSFLGSQQGANNKLHLDNPFRNEGASINTCCVSNPDKTLQFNSKLEETFAEEMPATDTIDSKWTRLLNAMYSSVLAVYGKKAW